MTKYGIFFAGLFLLVPAGAIIASVSRRVRDLVFFSLVFSIIFAVKYDINFISREWYRGTTRGIEISFVDFLALVLLAGALAGMYRDRRRFFWPPCLGPQLLFLAYCCLSVAMSTPQLFGLFGLSKLLRGIVIFLAVVFYVRSSRELKLFIVAQSAAMIYLGYNAIMQRYALGYFRVNGTLPHANILANYCAAVAPVLLATLFTRSSRSLRAFAGAGWALALVATILSISRMGNFAFVLATLGVAAAGSRSARGSHRLALVAGVLLVGVILLARGWDKLEERNRIDQSFGAITTQSEETGLRGFHYAVGLLIASEHVFGSGLNNWSFVVSNEYGPRLGETYGTYSGTDEPPEGIPSVFAHSLIGLTLGELGWPGLLLFAYFWLRCLLLGLRSLFAENPDFVTMIAMGCFFAFASMLVTNLTECNYWFPHELLLFHTTLGVSAAISRMGHVGSGDGQR
jgi:hypothetical protein